MIINGLSLFVLIVRKEERTLQNKLDKMPNTLTNHSTIQLLIVLILLNRAFIEMY